MFFFILTYHRLFDILTQEGDSMSFTSIVKNEVSKLETSKLEKISELSAIIRNSSITEKIKITTENASVARRVFNLIKELYFITPSIIVRKGFNYQKNYLYILEMKMKGNYILNDLSITDNNKFLEVPETYIIDDEETKRAYL